MHSLGSSHCVFSVKESAMILLQTVPTHIQVKNLQDKLLEKVSTGMTFTSLKADCTMCGS